jgi:hypothetical protein
MVRKALLALAVGGLAAGALAAAAVLIKVGGGAAESVPKQRATPLDLVAFSSEPPTRSLHLLFIHHSCGGQLLAPAGADVMRGSGTCIYESHPQGGDLRRRLTDSHYLVHEASYGSLVGNQTDLFDWVPKFRDQMPRVLKTAQQDETLPGSTSNDGVVFKSCFPNNEFESAGDPPGNPNGPALTVWNAKAALGALLPIFRAHPNVLFVYVTAPPMAPRAPKLRAYRWLWQKLRGKSAGSSLEQIAQSAELAREFNDWARSPEGWLKEYELPNVVVFDNYDLLTGEGRSNLLQYPTEQGTDSHPSREGNEKVAQALVPFLNRAVRRAGLGGAGKP